MRCRAKMQIKSVGGIIMNEDHCCLTSSHQGPHRGGKIGCIWDNNEIRMQNIEKSAEPVNKPRIFLAK